MITIEQLKTELREFIAAAKEIEGHWQVWPTHWAGGSNSVQVDGENTIWVDSDRGGEVCRFRTDNRCVSQSMYRKASFIARSRNISPKMAECLLLAVEGLEKSRDSLRVHLRDVDLWDSYNTQLNEILATWEASK